MGSGAVGGIRTPTMLLASTSSWCVCQFRHDRKSGSRWEGVEPSSRLAPGRSRTCNLPCTKHLDGAAGGSRTRTGTFVPRASETLLSTSSNTAALRRPPSSPWGIQEKAPMGAGFGVPGGTSIRIRDVKEVSPFAGAQKQQPRPSVWRAGVASPSPLLSV
jgi:hypothetical protein